MSIQVNDFRWEPGNNDVEYIKLLESSRDEWQKIAQKAIAKLKALSKAQEPRVLTYDEARNHAMQVMNPDSIKPLFIEFREKYDDEEEERPPWRGGYNQRLLLARSMDYNVHFRFWTDRPTPEQMEATPWN